MSIIYIVYVCTSIGYSVIIQIKWVEMSVYALVYKKNKNKNILAH